MSVALGLPACVQGARRCAAEPRLRRRASRPAPPCAARASPVSPAVGKQVAGVSAAPSSLPPLPVPLPVATALAAAAFSTLVMLLLRPGRNNGSIDGLASRGVGLAEDRGVAADKFYKGMMDGVRTVASPELSEDAVEAARARRRRSNTDERGVEEELGATKVPSNHPWASSKQKLTKEEEDAKREKVFKLNRGRARGDSDE